MFERFHQDARAAVVQARDEAIRAGQREIGTEHLLIALLDGPGLAADALTAAGADAADLRARIPHGEAGQQEPLDGDALASIGIDLDTVRRASDAAFGAGSLDRVKAGRRGRRGITDGIRMTKDAKKALELALRAAVRHDHRHISSGHLLLGITDQAASPAVTALTAAGIDTGSLRADVLRRMSVAA
jgi:ATP-dependent Clp protease ATP-binding subunit ClpA